MEGLASQATHATMNKQLRPVPDDTMNITQSMFAVLAVMLGIAVSTAQPPPLAPIPHQVKEPARSEKVDLQLRYRIRADRDERIRQFRALEKNLDALGFDDARKDELDRDLDLLDPTAERLTGVIPSDRVLDVLNDPRVENILFAPTGFMYPATPDGPVRIRIVLRGDLIPIYQQSLHNQTLEHLQRLGFLEALGYDTRRYTQIKGTIPNKHLGTLLKDLRTVPAGWFLSETPLDRLPRPFADRNPIRWVEVMPAAEAVAPFTPEVLLPTRTKLTPELRAALDDPALKETPVRVIALFATPVEGRLEQLRTYLASEYPPTVKRDAAGEIVKGPFGQPALTEGAALDGAVAHLASIRFDRPADAERFAQAADVLTVRLPTHASSTLFQINAPDKPAPTADILKLSGINAMHKLGYTGTGVKVLVVGTDFTGADKFIGKGLPEKTRILDLTTELNPDIVPSPSDPNLAGSGISTARAVALAAPDAELVLVRIDPGAIFQLFGILRVARGEAEISDALRSRLTDITNKTLDLGKRKEAALAEYRTAFNDLADDDAAKARREAAKKWLDSVLAQQEELTRRIQRFNTFQKDVVSALSGARVIVNTLVWESGYPLDAMSQLSRTLEKMATPLPPRIVRRAGDPLSAPKPPLVWVQASSMGGASIWGGPVVDSNRDAAMEFMQPDEPLPTSNWSADMNFLGFAVPKGETLPELPANTTVRVTMQWREPLDQNFPSPDRPIYPAVLRIFRQIDPEGKSIPSDEMSEESRSAGGPYPILLTDSFVVFEQVVDFTTKEAGRYALVVAKGYDADALLPALKRQAEITPRIVLETRSSKPGEARAVFRSFVTTQAGVGIPGDSLGAITVGIPVLGEQVGGGTGITLRCKPDIYGPDSADTEGITLRGTGVASGFLGGMAATLVQAGAAGANVFQSSGFEPCRMAIIPEFWLRYLRPASVRPVK